MLWLDNRVVTCMATNCQPQEIGHVQRRLRDGTRKDISCPAAVMKYNKYMGGVDRNDQLRQYYHVRLKGRKYYKYIFWFVFESSIANAYILHRNYSSHVLKSYKEFRLSLAKGLVGDYSSRKRPGHGLSVRVNLPLRHFPIKAKTSSSKGTSRCWHCTHCRHPPRRRETVWFCSECDLHLCLTGLGDGSDCFLVHHQHL